MKCPLLLKESDAALGLVGTPLPTLTTGTSETLIQGAPKRAIT